PLTLCDGRPGGGPPIGPARASVGAGVPQCGSFWAAQVAVVAAGGVVRRNPRGREIGVARKIALNEAGRAHPMYAGKAAVFDACCTHVDAVETLPPGAVALASNAMAPVQAVAVTFGGGSFWAPQYHLEFDLFELSKLMASRADLLVAEGFFADRAAADRYCAGLAALHREPGRADLRYQLGIDDDVLDEAVRLAELRNWIERLVVPSRRR